MSDFLLLAAALVAFAVALGACAALRALAVRRGLLDKPNERSLHKTPVPRLGGVAIVVGVGASAGLFFALSGGVSRPALACLVASFPIACLGLVDDLRPLRASTRLILQLASAAAFCLAVGLPECLPVNAGTCLDLPSPLALCGWVLAIVFGLNVFNFMDGMDGLAGTQTVWAAGAIALVLFHAGDLDLAAICALVAAASVGFLFYNAPPARIFMGDAGSTFLGFTFGAMALLGARAKPPVPVPVFLLALAPFVLDGLGTLLRRAVRREPVWHAHRTHLYQRAVTAGRSHLQVLVVYNAWAALSSAAAVWAATGSRSRLVEAGMAVGLAWLLVRLWVVRLEGRPLTR